MFRRKFTMLAAVALAGLAIFVVAACGSDDDSSTAGTSAASTSAGSTTGGGAAGSKGTIDIAYLDEQSGPLSYLSSADIAKAAVESANAAGGVNGHKINMKVYDTGGSPQTGVAAVRKAINDKPTAVLWATTASADSGLKLLARSGIPGFTSGGSPGAYTTDKTFFQWAGKTLGASSTSWGNYCVKNLGKKKIAIPGSTTPGVEVQADLWADMIKSIGGEVVFKRVGMDTTNNATITQVAKQVKDSGAQCVLSLVFPGVAQLQVALNQLGADIPIIASDAYGPEIEKEFGKSADGLLYTNYFASLQDTSNPGVKQYLADTAKYAPGTNAICICALGYGTVKFFNHVLSQVQGDVTAQKLIDIADKTNGYDADGLLPPIVFPRNHTEPTPCAGYSQLKDGKWTAVDGGGVNGLVCGTAFPPAPKG